MGPRGAGHYVKMVHNGIEYGDMQLIAEVYDLLSRGAGVPAPSSPTFSQSGIDGDLRSYLVEITAQVLEHVDPDTAGRSSTSSSTRRSRRAPASG